MTLRMNGSTSGFVELDCQATGGNNNIKLPSSNGSANQFLKNGSSAGTLGWSSLVEDSSGRVLIGTGTATANGGVLQVSNGITFPATQSSCSDPNTLDDYEEGTWTPTTNSPGGLSFTGTPKYTKIGRQVTINVETVAFPATTNAATLTLAGLPFLCDSNNNGTASLICNNSYLQKLLIVASTTTIYFYSSAGTSTTTITNGTSGTPSVYALSCTYFVP